MVPLKTEETTIASWLSGKKSYIVAGVTFVAALVHAWSANDWSSFAPYLAGSTGLAAVRAAIAKVEAALAATAK